MQRLMSRLKRGGEEFDELMICKLFDLTTQQIGKSVTHQLNKSKT